MLDFSLVLPTRGRPHLVQRLFENLLETTQNPNQIEIILYVDEDDVLSLELDSSFFQIQKIIGKPNQSMGAITQTCFKQSRGRFIVLINDDMMIRTRAWDEKVKEAFLHFSDNIAMAYPNDHYYGSKMSTFPILSRLTCELMDSICPPDYWRHCIDAHVFDIFKRLSKLGYGRAIYLKQVVFEHMHLSVDNAQGQSSDIEDQKKFVALSHQRQQTAECLKKAIDQSLHNISLKEKINPVSLILYHSSYCPEMLEIFLSRYFIKLNHSLLSEIICVFPEKTKKFKSHRYMQLPVYEITWNKNETFSQIMNRAVVQAVSENIVFLDIASEIESSWLEILQSTTSQAPIVASRWIHPRTGRVESCGLVFSHQSQDWIIARLYQGLHVADISNSIASRQAVELSGSLFKKDLFSRFGGFSNDYAGFEVIDFCLRLKRQKVDIVMSTAAIYYENSDFPKVLKLDENASFLKQTDGILKSDLETILKEDGFKLSKIEDHPFVLNYS